MLRFCKDLAHAGAKVALLDLNLEMGQKYAEDIAAEGDFAAAYGCNVLDKEMCIAVAQTVQNELGSCEVLINSRGQ